jgi:L-aspartate oxidase
LAERIPSGVQGPEASGALRAVLGEDPIDDIGCTALERRAAPVRPGAGGAPDLDITKLRDTLQRAMTRGAGVVRTAESLDGARAVVDEMAALLGHSAVSVGAGELANMLQLAGALLASALARTESRGAHLRREYPDTVRSWRRRLVHGQVPAGVPARP